jgi:hypothetical protein
MSCPRSKQKYSEEQITNRVCDFPPDSNSEDLQLLVKDPVYVAEIAGDPSQAM